MDVNPAALEDNADQLETFRRQWREEVERRTYQEAHQPSQRIAQDGKNVKTTDKRETSIEQHAFDEQPRRAPRGFGHGGMLGRDADTMEAEESPVQSAKDAEQQQLGNQSMAVKFYEEGTQHERIGNVAAALSLYQRAFKLDENVDQHWRSLWQNGGLDAIKPKAPKEEHVDFAPHFVPGGNPVSLTTLADEFADMTLHFNPRRVDKPVILERLPNEVVICVLQQLGVVDVHSLVSTGLVCKKMYILTREQTIWRFLCEHVYRPTRSMRTIGPLAAEVSLYGDWKRMYLGKPRLRFDGVYISRIHYWRPGHGDSGFNQPFILVTYFRYLRFYADGTVISLCTSLEPIEVIKVLKSGSRPKGMMNGTWTLTQNVLDMQLRDKDRPRQLFTMHMTIHSPRYGQWNQIKWTSYQSSTAGGEAVPFPSKDLKNFYFSRVRSWA